jgi:biotin operon repressor
MRGDPEITIAGLAKNLSAADRAIKKQIEKLKAEGRIRRIGPGKGSHCQSFDRQYPASP